MLTYLGTIANGDMVVIACHDDCSNSLYHDQKTSIASYCGSSITSIGYRHSFLCVFTKNVVKHYDAVSSGACLSYDIGTVARVAREARQVFTRMGLRQ